MKHISNAPECLSSGPDRHRKPFSSEAQPWLDALKRQAARWGESFDLIERIIAYRSAPGINRPSDRDDPIKYVLSIEILGLHQDPEALKQSLKDDDDLCDTWTFFQPDMMRSMMDKDIGRAMGNLDEWIPYPCALGEEVIDVRENEAWLIYDRQRAIAVEMGKEVAARARSQGDGLLSLEEKGCLITRLENLDGYIRGQELLARWDLYPHELTHCLVLGLQAYSWEDLSPVGSAHTITSRMMEAARRAIQTRPGARAAEYPRFHIGADRGELLPRRFIPFVFEEATEGFPSEQSVSNCHSQLLLQIEEVEKFEEEYGLGPERSSVRGATAAKGSSIDEKEEGLCFYRSGDHWLVGQQGKETHINHMKGLAYLHILLTHPGQKISCSDLYHNFGMLNGDTEIGQVYDNKLEVARSTEQKILDRKAIIALEKNLTDLTEELKVLDQVDFSNPEEKVIRKESLKSEINNLKAYLDGSRGTFSASSAEQGKNVNLRTTVKRSIDSALKKLAEVCPETAKFLNGETVSTGYSCTYGPKTSLIPRWTLSPPSSSFRYDQNT